MNCVYFEISQDSHFPIDNLPYGVFTTNENTLKRIGCAVGDMIIDLTLLEELGEFELITKNKIFSSSTLNSFINQDRSVWKDVRYKLQSILTDSKSIISYNPQLLVKQNIAMMHLPVMVGDYTDFYSSKEHAVNVGTMFRGKENALNPNWLHLPVAYHGRASSVVVSQTPIYRPYGQIKPDDGAPIFKKSSALDFELEMGAIIGQGNSLGQQISTEDAIDHVFGMVLVNDWSARDIQKWEYVPLGPFLGKNFATSISPWVVTMDALEPFRVSAPNQEPEPLDYLKRVGKTAYDINLDVLLRTKKTSKDEKIVSSNYKYLYWDLAQQIAHHTVGGCNMRVGDLIASGTISGPNRNSMGSMLEIAWKGTMPLHLNSGETRAYLDDGDTVTISGVCQKDDLTIGFGSVAGTIV